LDPSGMSSINLLFTKYYGNKIEDGKGGTCITHRGKREIHTKPVKTSCENLKNTGEEINMSRALVTINAAWIRKRIYCTLTQLVSTLQESLHGTLGLLFVTVFTCCCLVAAFNGGLSPFSGFLNCPRPQLPASHSNWTPGYLTATPNLSYL
jgi:hypothetical protein